MQKMMTYSEANSVLGSSLTPANRCLSKAVAIANDADPDLLANFDNARLVPANVIEPATHWIDEHTIEHYFVDEDGNNIGTDLNIVVPKDAAYYMLRTKALLDGQPFPDDMKGGSTYADDQHPYESDWVHNFGNISGSIQSRYTNTKYDVYWYANVRNINDGTTGHWPVSEDDGTTYFIIKFRDVADDDDRWGTSGNFAAGIDINTDTAQQIKMDYKGSLDPWNVIARFSKDSSTDYYLSKTLVKFRRNTPIEECEDTITVTGFEEGFDVEYIGWNRESDTLYRNDDNKFSNVSVPSRTGNNTIKISGVSEPQVTGTDGIYNIYKVTSATDSNKFFYFQVVRER